MHWSPLLVDEMSRALVKTGRTTNDEARRNADAMHASVPGAMVSVLEVQSVFAAAWPGVNDAKDLHVAACAVALHAFAYYPGASKVHLITRNAKDFATKKLMALGVVQRHPDAFLLEQWDDEPAAMAESFRRLRHDLPSRPSVETLLVKLGNDGQRRTAAALLGAHASGAFAL